MKDTLLVILMCWLTNVCQGQFYKYFDLEVAANSSLVVNKEEFVSEIYAIYREQIISKQHSAFYLNYNVSLGISVFNNHLIRFKYGINNTGVRITGEFIEGDDTFSIPIVRSFDNFKNTLHSKYWSIGYEYKHPIKNDYLLFGIQFNRQTSMYIDVAFAFEGLGGINYALGGYAGYQKKIYKGISFVGKLTILNSFSARGQIWPVPRSEFIPIQYGLEFGIRFELEN